MSAIGELLVYIIYFILGLCFLNFFILVLITNKNKKPYIISSVFFGLLLVVFILSQYIGYLNDQKNQVGIYYLTNYPSCDDCFIELKEDMTYIVVKDKENIKNGNWHHESGGDYFITYLDGKENQLGSGEFRYNNYNLKNK